GATIERRSGERPACPPVAASGPLARFFQSRQPGRSGLRQAGTQAGRGDEDRPHGTTAMHPLYRILEDRPVKRGTNAILWHAHDEVLDREVAVKELRNWAARPPRARALFQFSHLRRLSLRHPGLAPVHGEDSDRGWLTLDYYPAGSLGDRLAHDG